MRKISQEYLNKHNVLSNTTLGFEKFQKPKFRNSRNDTMRSSTRQFFLNFHRDDINLYLFRLSIDLELARKIPSFFFFHNSSAFPSDPTFQEFPRETQRRSLGKKRR